MESHITGRRLLCAIASLALLTAITANPVLASTPAAACPPASVGGAAVGSITVGSLTVPVKAVRMAPDGGLDAAPSNRVASVVVDYRSIKAVSGTTVLLWHSRYGVGCNGTLNVLFHKRAGFRFNVTDAAGTTHHYVISAAHTVVKGAYQAAWFRMGGPRQLTLITCTGLISNVFTRNYVITAVPA